MTEYMAFAAGWAANGAVGINFIRSQDQWHILSIEAKGGRYLSFPVRQGADGEARIDEIVSAWLEKARG